MPIEFFSFLQILMQSASAILAIILFRTSHIEGWGYLSGAFLLMVARRFTALISLNGTHEIISQFDKIVLPLIISILILRGLVLIHHSYQK